MLSATDVHYLVGLLTSVSTPENVEVTLGDLVHDISTGSRRDVDVTVAYKDAEGSVSVFKGIEVKRHLRPLDVTHVEQLCAKLNDMPSICHKAIVSASGYRQPAVKKAKAHGVDLFSLIAWDNPMKGFEHVCFPPEFFIKERSLIWVNEPHIEFDPNEDIPDELRKQFTNRSPISNADGKTDGTCRTLHDLGQMVRQNVLNAIADQEAVKSTAPGSEMNVKYLSQRIGNFCVELEGSKLALHTALIQGNVKWTERSISPEFKVLIKEGELVPHVGCAIAELSNGNLIGFTVSQVDRDLKRINIPVSERNREKIRLLRLR